MPNTIGSMLTSRCCTAAAAAAAAQLPGDTTATLRHELIANVYCASSKVHPAAYASSYQAPHAACPTRASPSAKGMAFSKSSIAYSIAAICLCLHAGEVFMP
jgi:hypothetical protein